MSSTAGTNLGRRVLHCRTCRRPMQGHPRGMRNPCRSNTVTPQNRESLEEEVTDDEGPLDSEPEDISEFAHSCASPPPTHDPSPTPSIQRSESQSSFIKVEKPVDGPLSPLLRRPAPYPQRIASQPSFVIPETGPFYRRNPNYVFPPPQPVQSPPLLHSTGSLVPTLIVGSDGEPAAPRVRSATPAIDDTPVRDREGSALPGGFISEKTSQHRHGSVSPASTDYWPGSDTFSPGPSNEYSVTSRVHVPMVDALQWPQRVASYIVDKAPQFLVYLTANVLGHYITKKYLNW